MSLSATSPAVRTPVLSPTTNRSIETPARNPVSQRLYRILGSSFDDPASREALVTLSDFYTPTNSSGSGSKNSEEDDDDWDDDEFLDDAVGHTNTASAAERPTGGVASNARKYMRRDVEQKLAESSKHFLEAFGTVNQQLDVLQEHIRAMRAQCDGAEQQLEGANDACKSLLERAGSLREQRQAIASKQSIINMFLSRFTLSEDEVDTMTSRTVPMGKRFFQVMDKTQRIREDCRVLMAGEDGPSKAGLDIMSATSSYLEQAYDKIARYLASEFRQMGRDALLEVGPTLAEAVRRLNARPELLIESLQILVQTRQSALSGAFLDALTRGTPRPIELHAHDPMRYIGDMLAWIHQAVAAEREFLDALFGIKDARMVGSVRTFRATEEEEYIRALMDGAVGKLCGPLKARVQQTVRSQESAIVAYKVANLLQFYLLTMKRTLGEESSLCKTLQELTDVSYKVFFDAIEAQGRALLRVALDIQNGELTPPLAVLDHCQVLKEIMSVYQSSLAGEDSEEDQNEGFRRVLDIMIDPAVEMCVSAADRKDKQVARWDKPIFVLNCLTYLQNVLEPYSFTSEKQQMIEGLVQQRVHELTEEHYQNILRDAGLDTLVETLDRRKDKEPLSRIPAAQPQQLQKYLHRFSIWLSGLEVVQSPRLLHLNLQKLHTRIHQAALQRLAKTYKRICDEVKRPENKYEAAATLLGGERPFGQLHLLWQIFGLEGVVDDA
ncbi:oligomeric complex COG6 [Punctularia strigosozonata HHB-11173 SS5]|uniref:oligomeric complex COG6 n=1 Tax=Punctularia strigosozonata (strain HHB-11173) TaxID=741275 RepID=UPI00044180F6|nr:oligomeric complex COG6 [Punctularia strigosozonata HHB-11173 SS5]EIN07029.1 oligomeric complex COG6 [Punctularia strigosozonata HHB-11173 SS5]